MDERLFPSLGRLLSLALEEDLGEGDLTSQALVRENVHGRAEIVAKDEGILAGVPIAVRVFDALDARIRVESSLSDGAALRPGDVVLTLSGPARGLLSGERTALNFLSHLSGVATQARRFQEAAGPVAVYDTRKTTPGFRSLEKYAVRVGGGQNHRMGLFDACLVKENHLRASGITDMAEIIRLCRDASPPNTSVEVEVETLEEFRAALQGGADIIMLDDMTNQEVEAALAMRAGLKAELEVSGGVTLGRLEAGSIPAVDRLSAGALTHSALPVDMALYMRDTWRDGEGV